MFSRFLSGALVVLCSQFMCQLASAHPIEDWRPTFLASLGLQVRGTVVEFNAKFCAAADDALSGTELWCSDGTAEGTYMVMDINPGLASAWPQGLQELNERLFFQADNGLIGRELWATDGSAEGTVLIRDIQPGSVSASPNDFVAMGGRVYFRAYHELTGWELWGSDGTDAGTMLVADIAAGSVSSVPMWLVATDSTIYFRANDGIHGAELWRSDGTASGTALVSDIVAGPEGSAPFYLNVNDSTLLFRAYDSLLGTALWISNGTELGTRAVPGFVPGTARLSWTPPSFNVDGSGLTDLAGHRVIYRAVDPAEPYELGRTLRVGQIDITDPAAVSHNLEFLPPGYYFFALKAVNASGVESDTSVVVSKRIY